MSEPPVVLVRWYALSKWLLCRIESFPKSQRFVLGQRLAHGALAVMETLVEASTTPAGRPKADLLARANRELEVLRWLVRLAHERTLLTARQYRYAAVALEECGRMVGGWRKQAAGRAATAKLAELRLAMHPDKYRLRPTRHGVDFVGFVGFLVFADGRIRLRRASVRRFERRYRRRRWEVERFGADAEGLSQSVRSWVAHARHARSRDLRRAVLGRR